MFRFPRKLGITYIIIALNVAMYVYTSIIGGDFITTGNLPIHLYQSNYDVMNGSYWQLITAIFVHVNIVHLVSNMIFLLIFGLRAEELFKSEEYVAIYFLSGLAGNLLTLLLGPQMVSAGASGAIFGMFGAVIIYIKRRVGQSIGSALIYAFFMLLLSMGIQVNFMAHLGGLAAGLLFGYWLATTRKAKSIYQFRFNYST
ncbi:rhomboid family intramembrane serine protease [Candidatus Bathyarchaeota archaeon]|nr:rhomboid family intramembrane serine protease [Candidatus Bathyarchaeota archaeon]